MKIVLIDCALPINTRNEKILRSFAHYMPEAELHVITWARESGKTFDNSISGAEYHIYEKLSPLQNLSRKFINMFGFRRYIGKQLCHINPDIVIASHWSNLILTFSFMHRGQKLIYENLDVPTNKFIVRKLTEIIEHISLLRTDFIIYASRFFESHYSNRIPHFVLENKPMFGVCHIETQPIKDKLKVAYIGSVRYISIMQNLIDAVRGNSHIELYIHGDGPDLESLRQYSTGLQNVQFTGRYSYDDIIHLYQAADVVWAAYPNKDYNVKYAISNKFHESLFVGVPCIYSDHTKLADFVVKHNIGIEVDPYSAKSITAVFEDLISGKIDITEIKHSMMLYQKHETTWDEDFQKLLKML